jgi:NADH-quinone oxidoreductase subunit C
MRLDPGRARRADWRADADGEAARLPRGGAQLRDHPDLRFEELIDLCGVDYSTYGDARRRQRRAIAVVVAPAVGHAQLAAAPAQLLRRRRVSVLPSLIDVWPSVNWYEREAFDLFGIVFDGHPTCAASSPTTASIAIRSARISDHAATVEMRYDPEHEARGLPAGISIEPAGSHDPQIVAKRTTRMTRLNRWP